MTAAGLDRIEFPLLILEQLDKAMLAAGNCWRLPPNSFHDRRMASRFALLAAPMLLTLAAAAPAQQPAVPASAPPELVHVAVNTEMGTIVLALDRQ
jgi:hypothetical protein